MSGSNSFDPAGSRPESASAIALTVHSMPSAAIDEAARRTAGGRLRMLLVLLVCAAPVVASYIAYFVIRPQARTNYSELIVPSRPLPATLKLVDLEGRKARADALKGQWLLVVVSGGACDAVCERHLWIQRQLREALGSERDRVDKVWLLDDQAAPRLQTLEAIGTGTGLGIGAPTTVLRAEPDALAAWLEPAPGHRLEEHMYIVDPRGDWMMRVPVDPDPARLKRDIEKLLRASAGWDQPGR